MSTFRMVSARRAVAWHVVATAVVLLAMGGRASATTIGVFDYDVDSFFGPVFTVVNSTSGLIDADGNDLSGTLADVSIELFDGPTSVDTLFFGSITPLDLLAQSIDDLTGLSFTSAVLSLTFSHPGTIVVAPLTGLTFDANTFTGSTVTSEIEFTPESSPVPVPVPEPPTLALLGITLGLLMGIRRRARFVPRPLNVDVYAGGPDCANRGTRLFQ